jgi:hypothetical protein
MAKTRRRGKPGRKIARTAGTASRKKTPQTKKKVAAKRKKASAGATKKVTPRSKQDFVAFAAPAAVALRAGVDPNALSIAVIRCVTRTLDTDQPLWNSDGNGNSRTMDYFGYESNGMKTFLGAVNQCLLPKYTVAINKMSMNDCVSATVTKLESLIIANTSAR